MSLLRGRSIYLDTNVFIYALEGYADYAADLTALFESVDRGERKAVTSELTLAEVLVKPFMDQSHERQRAYEQAIQSSEALTVRPVSRDVLIEAARLRATIGLRLPDAIHLAMARLAGCETFLTNDRDLQMRAIPEVVLLSEAIRP